MGFSLYLVLNNKILRPNETWRLMFLSFLFLVYLFIGSYIFYAINLPIELKEKQDLNDYLIKWKTDHPCIDQNDLDDFIGLIESSISNGIVFATPSNYNNNLTEMSFAQNWEFGGETIFFVFTLLATIGYGNVSPLTDNGKIFCIIYLILGVPLTIALLTIIVDRIEFGITGYSTVINQFKMMNRSNKKKGIYNTINSNEKNHEAALVTGKFNFKNCSSIDDSKVREKALRNHNQQQQQHQQKNSQQNNKLYKFCCSNIYFQSFIVGLILVLFIYVLPAFLFTYYTEKEWSYLDAIYFIFISITTIGFGDFVPGDMYTSPTRGWYRLAITSMFFFYTKEYSKSILNRLI
jgi:hypothetical protein